VDVLEDLFLLLTKLDKEATPFVSDPVLGRRVKAAVAVRLGSDAVEDVPSS